jgi:hypothetical protein
MKKEYDFANGERGKFYNPETKYKLPVYLDDDIQAFFVELAKKKNVNLNVLVNNTIKANIELYQALK